MGGGNYSRKPSGNIYPCRFVVLQSDNTVQAAGANGDIWGIADKYTRNYPLEGRGGDDPAYIGISGDPAINIFGFGADECLLELGGTVTIGQLIKSGAAGVGVAATSDADKVGARAEQSGVSGQRIRVKPLRYDRAS